MGKGQEATRGSGAAEREAGACRRDDVEDRNSSSVLALRFRGWIRSSRDLGQKNDVPVRNKVLNENSLGGHLRVKRVRQRV